MSFRAVGRRARSTDGKAGRAREAHSDRGHTSPSQPRSRGREKSGRVRVARAPADYLGPARGVRHEHFEPVPPRGFPRKRLPAAPWFARVGRASDRRWGLAPDVQCRRSSGTGVCYALGARGRRKLELAGRQVRGAPLARARGSVRFALPAGLWCARCSFVGARVPRRAKGRGPSSWGRSYGCEDSIQQPVAEFGGRDRLRRVERLVAGEQGTIGGIVGQSPVGAADE